MGHDPDEQDKNGADDESAEIDETTPHVHIQALYDELSELVRGAGKQREHTMEGVLRAALARGGDEDGVAVATDSLSSSEDRAAQARSQTTAVIVGARREAGTVTHTATATATPAPADAAIPPSTRIHQYELIRQLGRGGMGAVYLARDTRLGRRVAIKFLRQPGGGLSDRFLIEAQATARCSHENIVVIHDFGEHDGQSYMVLEYIEGRPLSAWLSEHARIDGRARREPLSPGVAVEIMIPVVRALVCAHEMGIVHRDLKPANIMLTSTGAVKVLDFGIAKLLQPVQTEADGLHAPVATAPGVLIGTLPYMSPEQLRGEPVDHRTDIWAVGVMLFEMVTGVHPTHAHQAGKRPNALLAALLNATDIDTPMPSVSELRPDLGALGGIIDRCLLKNPEHRMSSARLLLGELELVSKASRGSALGESMSPFTGLSAFQESDAERFFGRDQDIAGLVMKLRSQPMVTVAGPSGTGKSSLVRAGIIPTLKRSGEGWEAITIRPGREPLAVLAAILVNQPWESSAQHAGDPAESGRIDRMSVTSRLRKEPGYLGSELRAWARARLRRLVLFIDQFEELYTLGTDVEQRRCFLSCIEAVADDAASPLRVIQTVRSDFLDRIVEDRAFMDAVNRGLVFLSPLDREGLGAALIKPVEACDYRFEDSAMVERILDELITARGALPLLQFTASKLWAKRDRERRLLTEVSLRELGGVAGALADHADAVLATMTAHDTRLARAIFLRLVTPERTRGLATMTELRQLGPAPDGMERVLGRLIEARLLAVDGDDGGASRTGEDAGTVEISHESLIEAWPLLARWLDENEDDTVFLARLRSAAKDWERSGQAAGLLWTGEAANEARAWRERYQGELAPGEERYLSAVFGAAERSRKRQRRLFVSALSAAMAATMAMAYLAWQESRASNAASRAAARAEQEASRAEWEAMRARDATRVAVVRSLPGDPTTQVALLREIEIKNPPPPGVTEEVSRLLHTDVAQVVLTGHTNIVGSASFSPDGRYIASASSDKTVRVWNADGSGEPRVLRGHHDEVSSVAFSSDGALIVSASRDKTVRVWNADGSGEPLALQGHDDVVLSASFSPDGRHVVSASADTTMRMWDMEHPGSSQVFSGHSGAVWSAFFSPDGESIVSASSDRTIRIWDVRTQQSRLLRGHDDGVLSASFSPDGKFIASSSRDKTVRIWRSDGAGEPYVLRGHDDAVWSAFFSPDGRRIVSASRDRTMRIWDSEAMGKAKVLQGHGDGVLWAAFSPDGRSVVSASSDKTVRVWRVSVVEESRILRGHEDSVLSATFSLDGKHIVSASRDKTVRVWNSDGTGQTRILRGHGGWVAVATFSRDGSLIASASSDGTIRIWKNDGTEEALVLSGHLDEVTCVAFSPDGKQVVSSSRDKTLRIWSIDGSAEPRILIGHTDEVMAASFSPDGRRVVSASRDGALRIWNLEASGEPPQVLRGHPDTIHSVSYSPDGRHIVSASRDKTVRLWDANGGGELRVLRGHDDWVLSAEFSSDGKRIVSASKDKTIRIWSMDDGVEPIVLLGHANWANTASFSKNGDLIVSASDDRTIRIWHSLAAMRLDDPFLWAVTSYCMSVDIRVELLGLSEALARRDHQRCIQRVKQAQRTDLHPAP